MSTVAVYKPLKIIAILFGLITLIYGDCNLRLSSDLILRPKIFQTIGSSKIILPVANNEEYFRLFENQKVELFCDTEFEYPKTRNSGSNNNVVNVFCKDNSLHNQYYYSSREAFQCSILKWKLYESDDLVWCPTNSTSYILARPMNNSSEYFAGICYDTDSNSLKSLYYRMTPKYDNNYRPSLLTKIYSLYDEIEHYREIFWKRRVNEENYDNEVFRDWIKFSKYNLSSILQIPRINNLFYAGSFLDFVWWPSLRLGNWKRYEIALERHIENSKQSYDILAGLSDVVKAPIIENCNTNFTFKLLNDNVNRQIPFYVWNYLHAADNSSEIVIIAVNSPFYEFYDKNDIIFCKDKCQEIPWLKSTSSTFRYSALGIIFCCSVDEVKTSKRLEGFPTIMNVPLPPPSPDNVPVYVQ